MPLHLPSLRGTSESCDVSRDRIDETAALVNKAGGNAHAVKCDVTQEAEIKSALDETIKVFGRLDLAFNNAGVEEQNADPTAEETIEEWDRLINVNLRGVFLCMKYELQLMLKQGGGSISTRLPEQASSVSKARRRTLPANTV